MDAIKLPFKFDPLIIKKEISQFKKSEYYDICNPSVILKTLWSKHLIDPIGGPETIPVFKPNDALKKCPYILSILETFKCKKETFRIHTLDPKSNIKPHRDFGFSFESGKTRIHIPVETNDDVLLLLNDKPIKMKAGETWYCDFSIKHEVQNNSTKPRTHLIMDCMVNDWLTKLFEKSTRTNHNIK